MPFDTLEQVVWVLTYGAEKYSADNWRSVQDGESRYFAAAMRHLVKWKSGEIEDPESGLPHLSHAICSLLFVQELGK